ncbi:MOSC domain-containing protein [Sphaerotilus sp.]|uniref:MOSC domain-containing protein n=1 Tax=Sphaerotilus sp. TaxID=2093942 RepID=UPI0025D00C14|nr:MOSC N-terminal beta barrel domain-containing protein [Sphaerotilus sp.]
MTAFDLASLPADGHHDGDDDDGSSPVTIARLHVYPIKSCAGLSLARTDLAATGFAHDRQWMLIDDQHEFLSQREHARMALIRPALGEDGVLTVTAPGCGPLGLPAVAVGETLRVRVWDDAVEARAGDPAADRWFSDFLGEQVRLVQFAPGQRRLSSARWTGAVEAENTFSDGYPILVVSVAALDELNHRLALGGHAPVTMARFRPNLVLDGLGPHGEDGLDELRFDTSDGPVTLRLVKPCPRCPIPNIDPDTAQSGVEPGDTLAGYRSDARVGGAITFGMNAVIVEGVGRWLAVGQGGRGTVRF